MPSIEPRFIQFHSVGTDQGEPPQGKVFLHLIHDRGSSEGLGPTRALSLEKLPYLQMCILFQSKWREANHFASVSYLSLKLSSKGYN